MKRKPVNRLVLVMTLIVLLGAGLTAVAGKKGGPTYLAKLTIDDSFPGRLLLSDGKGPYVDWRLTEDPDGADSCVKAWGRKRGKSFGDRSSEEGEIYLGENFFQRIVLREILEYNPINKTKLAFHDFLSLEEGIFKNNKMIGATVRFLYDLTGILTNFE